MQKFVLIIVWLFSVALAGFGGWWLARNSQEVALKVPTIAEKVRKYDKYSYDNLSTRQFSPGAITLEEVIADDPSYTAHLFSFYSEGKKVTGQINIPKSPMPQEGYPTILMIRGYAIKETYRTGSGTRNAAGYFAKQGFLTVAPDFLGYGGSDPRNEDLLEARFESYLVILNLLASLDNIEKADTSKLSIWAHSNGGHITMALLEITQRNIPATLWAPVTKPFPYSIMVYMDEEDDHGKQTRKMMADFEQDYDVDLYSINTYLDRVQAPIQLHQGTADLEIEKEWSDQIVKALKEKEKDVTYWVYPGADHNLSGGAWNIAVERDLAFFRKNFKD